MLEVLIALAACDKFGAKAIAQMTADNSATKIITHGERKIAVIKSINGDRIAVCPVAICPDVPHRDCIQEIKNIR